MSNVSLIGLILPAVNNLEIVEYYRSAGLFLQGQLPYADFYWEYPPGFLLVLILFRNLVSDIAVFRSIWFGFLCLCLIGIIFIFLSFFDSKIKRYPAWLVPIITMLMITLALTANKSFINPDVFVSLLILIAFLGLDKNSAYWSSFLLGWAAVIRVYPVLFFGLIFFKKINWQTKLWQAGFFLIPWLISFIYLGGLPVVIGFAQSFLAQMSRAVQIESVSGLIMVIYSWLGNKVYASVQPEYMAINLVFHQAPLSWDVVKLIKWVPLGISSYLIAKYNQYLFPNKWLFYQSCLLLVISLLIAHNVLSPQYLIWLWIPWGLWLVKGFQAKIVHKTLLLANILLMLLIHLLTTFYLSYYEVDKVNLLLNLDSQALLLIESRNLLMIIFWLILVISLKRSMVIWKKK